MIPPALVFGKLHFSFLDSHQAPPGSQLISCLALFSFGVDLDGGWQGDETPASEVCQVNSDECHHLDMTLRNPAFDSISRSIQVVN